MGAEGEEDDEEDEFYERYESPEPEQDEQEGQEDPVMSPQNTTNSDEFFQSDGTQRMSVTTIFLPSEVSAESPVRRQSQTEAMKTWLWAPGSPQSEVTTPRGSQSELLAAQNSQPGPRTPQGSSLEDGIQDTSTSTVHLDELEAPSQVQSGPSTPARGHHGPSTPYSTLCARLRGSISSLYPQPWVDADGQDAHRTPTPRARVKSQS